MNYCRKCQSDYERPGTCNCFAQQAAQPAFVPWYPVYHPVYPSYTPWWSVTVTAPNADLSSPTTWVDLSAWGYSMVGGDTSVMLKD